MYGIIGEDRSDVDAIKTIVKRVSGQENITVKTKGYSGCGEMLRKGATQLKLFSNLGMTRFIVCYDSDRDDPDARYKKAHAQIVSPSGVDDACVVVPVQELEAWILADLSAVAKVISSWAPQAHGNPESVSDPKEHIERLSRTAKRKPRYSHATHNPLVVQHIDLEIVYQKCPSYRPLHDFIKSYESPTA